MTTERDTVVESQTDLGDADKWPDGKPEEQETAPPPSVDESESTEDKSVDDDTTPVSEDGKSESKPDEKPAPRTFTEKEHKDGLSASQRETSELREQLAAQALENDITRLISEEQGFAAEDEEAVTSGDITTEQAATKKEQRRVAYVQSLEQQEGTNRYNTAMSRANVVARATLAETLSKEFPGVNEIALFEDQTITTSAEMRIKARELHLGIRETAIETNKEGSEAYDSALVGSTGIDTSNMSLMDRTELAYSQAETTRRNNNRRQ